VTKSIEERLAAVEQENARLRTRIARQNAAWLFGVLALVGGVAVAGVAVKDAVFNSIKARELVVIDAKGTVRARVSGDMPDAVMAGGHVSKRGDKAAGFMLYDSQGIERGGYVTTDEGGNAMLTLDSRQRMTAIMVAGPDEDQVGALSLTTRSGAIEMRADSNGPRLTTTDKDGVKFQQPVIAALSVESCSNFREIEKKYPGARACQKRFTDAACRACLDGAD
jgi:hypothetical protein